MSKPPLPSEDPRSARERAVSLMDELYQLGADPAARAQATTLFWAAESLERIATALEGQAGGS